MELINKRGNGISRAQSAMEYLMTYGWAILVIAVVLAALFALGVFNGSTLPTACIAQSGYLCKITAFTASQGMAVQIGQSTGVQWNGANVVFLSVSQLSSVSSSATLAPYFTTANEIQLGTLSSGSSATNTIPTAGISGVTSGSAIGTSVSGQLWVQYSVSGQSGFLYSEIATVTAKTTG